MFELQKGVRSIKTKPSRAKRKTIPKDNDLPIATKPANELHIWFEHISKIYSGNTDRFTVCSRSGNQYIMIAYHCDSNAIISATLKFNAYKHRLINYNIIIQRLKECSMLVDFHILGDEASA